MTSSEFIFTVAPVKSTCEVFPVTSNPTAFPSNVTVVCFALIVPVDPLSPVYIAKPSPLYFNFPPSILINPPFVATNPALPSLTSISAFSIFTIELSVAYTANPRVTPSSIPESSTFIVTL